MKKTIFLIMLFLFSLAVKAEDFKDIKYKNIENNEKIGIIDGNWTNKISRKNKNYYLKKTPSVFTSYSDYYSSNNDLAFSTNTNYEFIYKGQLIGYSNLDLKFYEYNFFDGEIHQRELCEGEIQELFPDYKIIKISEFSDTTNSLKIKKDKKDLKLILLNDTDASFNNYWFYTNNAKYEPYKLKGFLDITKKGMIQYARNDDNYEKNIWYILLIR